MDNRPDSVSVTGGQPAVTPLYWKIATTILKSEDRIRAEKFTSEQFSSADRDLLAYNIVAPEDTTLEHDDHVYDGSQYHIDDIKQLIKSFFDKYKNIYEWYGALIKERNIQVDFIDEEPSIAERNFIDWLHVISAYDTDSLIAYELVRQKRFAAASTPLDERLPRWGLVVRGLDRDLRSLYEKGTSDLHVHFGGTRAIPLLWQRIMQEKCRLKSIPRYSEQEIRRLGDNVKEIERLEYEKNNIRKAREIWNRSRCPHNSDRNSILSEYEKSENCYDKEKCKGMCLSMLKYKCYDFVNSEGITEEFRRILLAERTMLATAWQIIADASGSGRYDPSVKRVIRELDFYIYVKSNFIRKHQQAISDCRPGLPYFDKYFRAGKIIYDSQQAKELSGRVENISYGHSIRFLTETTSLRRLELRFAPIDSVTGYGRFIKRWRDVEKKLGDVNKNDLDIRFAIHFKRSNQGVRRKDQDTSEYRKIPFLDMRAAVDRDSAVLHMFRLRYPKLASKILRIDIAGRERDTPPDVFTFYMRLLRGDPDAFEELRSAPDEKSDPPAPPIYRKWKYILARGWARSPENLPSLGITCHAGEDYYHLIDGLRQVDEAIRGLKMRPGDSVGHALAVGADFRTFIEGRGKAVMLPRGLRFDSLVWLYSIIEQDHSDRFTHERQILHLWITQEGRALYSSLGDNIKPSVSACIELLNLRHGTIASPPRNKNSSDEENEAPKTKKRYQYDSDDKDKKHSDVPYMMWQHQLYDEDCRKKRSEFVKQDDIVLRLENAFRHAQSRVMEKIINCGIIIEANPSSNIRVGGNYNFKDLPIFEMLRRSQDEFGTRPRITVNTDNPGVFPTTVENEYTILWRGLRESGYNRNEALGHLRYFQKCGLEFAYWPTNRFL